MTRIYYVLALVPFLASAQEPNARPLQDAAQALKQIDRLRQDVELKMADAKLYAVSGAVMNSAVKGAPYSAVEISETTQVLGDGTRIHNETQVSVYRDSEGRIRREMPDEVTIWDPVANASYTLNPKEQTARKMPLGMTNFVQYAKAGVATVRWRTGGVTIEGPPAGGLHLMNTDAPLTFFFNNGVKPGPISGKPESLGKQPVEGVMAEGTRVSSTIEAGAIGNDRPILITSETWYSSELQTVLKTVHNDPRMGEEVFRLANISRVEPAAYLFQAPASYQLVERK